MIGIIDIMRKITEKGMVYKMKTKFSTAAAKTACVIFSAAALATLPGCYLLPQEEQVLEAPQISVATITYDTQTIQLSDIERWETGTGTFASRFSQSYSFEDDGILKQICVKSGQTVKQGDLLAELDTEDIEKRISYQEYMTEKARLS